MTRQQDLGIYRCSQSLLLCPRLIYGVKDYRDSICNNVYINLKKVEIYTVSIPVILYSLPLIGTNVVVVDDLFCKISNGLGRPSLLNDGLLVYSIPSTLCSNRFHVGLTLQSHMGVCWEEG